MIYIKPIEVYLKGFTSEGHAEYAEHGQDIVCASVSVLTQMVAYEIQYKGYGYVKDFHNGYLECIIDKDARDNASILIEMMLRALRGLEEQYPDYIKVEGEE